MKSSSKTVTEKKPAKKQQSKANEAKESVLETALVPTDRAMEVNVALPIGMDDLIRLPMRKFKDTCAANIAAFAEQHAKQTSELAAVRNELAEKISKLGESFCDFELKAFQGAFDLVGQHCELREIKRHVNEDNRTIVFDFKFAFGDSESKALKGSYHGDCIDFERVKTAVELSLTSYFLEIERLTAQAAKTAEYSTAWRKKLSDVSNVEDRFRCSMIRGQLDKFAQGNELLEGLENSLYNTELANLTTVAGISANEALGIVQSQR